MIKSPKTKKQQVIGRASLRIQRAWNKKSPWTDLASDETEVVITVYHQKESSGHKGAVSSEWTRFFTYS